MKLNLYRQAGMGRLGALLAILLTALCVFAMFEITPFFYSYQELQGLADFQAKRAKRLGQKKIRENMWKMLKSLDIPVDEPNELEIGEIDGALVIHLEYEEIFALDFGGEYYFEIMQFPFVVHAEEPIL